MPARRARSLESIRRIERPGPRARRAAPGRSDEAAWPARHASTAATWIGCGATCCRSPPTRVRALGGGERIDVAGAELEVAYTPGHAVASCTYFDSRRGSRSSATPRGIRRGPGSLRFAADASARHRPRGVARQRATASRRWDPEHAVPHPFRRVPGCATDFRRALRAPRRLEPTGSTTPGGRFARPRPASAAVRRRRLARLAPPRRGCRSRRLRPRRRAALFLAGTGEILDR